MTVGDLPERDHGIEPPTVRLPMASSAGGTSSEGAAAVGRGQLRPLGSEPPTVEIAPNSMPLPDSAELAPSPDRAAPSDHVELDLGLLAGVSDRGLKHHRNEDAMALATAQAEGGEIAVAVVCDGVSSSSRPDEAAQAAAQAAMQVLLTAVRAGHELRDAYGEAFGSAQQALLTMAEEEPVQGTAPSATFVSAVVTRADVTVCWLGDSRAYWLDATDGTDSLQLTSDDSIGRELISRGLLSETEALALPASHVVTGWIGADLSDATPHLMTFAPPGPGAVLLCSDGLWNYQSDAAALAAQALPGALSLPLQAAAGLVSFAIESGGHDNITVVLVPFPPGKRD